LTFELHFCFGLICHFRRLPNSSEPDDSEKRRRLLNGTFLPRLGNSIPATGFSNRTAQPLVASSFRSQFPVPTTGFVPPSTATKSSNNFWISREPNSNAFRNFPEAGDNFRAVLSPAGNSYRNSPAVSGNNFQFGARQASAVGNSPQFSPQTSRSSSQLSHTSIPLRASTSSPSVAAGVRAAGNTDLPAVSHSSLSSAGHADSVPHHAHMY